jgi:cytidylate kinase
MPSNLITIDGPSGAGKSTVAELVARKLGLRYLDTGAMYRAVTLHVMRKGARLEDPQAIVAALQGMELDLRMEGNAPMRVMLATRDVSDAIRTPEVTRNIHYVADIVQVRNRMVAMQREIGREGNLVTEGRDQGSVVFPDAGLKIYMFASPEVRARRRFNELQQRGQQSSYDEVLEDVSRRDYLDMGREVGALRKPADAVELDTSEMSAEQASEAIVALARQRLKPA